MLKRAKYSFSNEFCTSECVIRNISESGAFMDFADGLLVPDTFKLHNEMDGYKIDCEVVRRVGQSAGVRFVGPREPIKPVRQQNITIPRRAERDIRDQLSEHEIVADKGSAQPREIPTRVFEKKPRVFGRR